MRSKRRSTGPAPESRRRVPKNRWSLAMDRSPSVPTAVSRFGVYIAGALLLIISVWMAIAGLLLVGGAIGSGWQGRLVGSGLIVGAVVAFFVGRWATNQYAVQRRG